MSVPAIIQLFEPPDASSITNPKGNSSEWPKRVLLLYADWGSYYEATENGRRADPRCRDLFDNYEPKFLGEPTLIQMPDTYKECMPSVAGTVVYFEDLDIDDILAGRDPSPNIRQSWTVHAFLSDYHLKDLWNCWIQREAKRLGRKAWSHENAELGLHDELKITQVVEVKYGNTWYVDEEDGAPYVAIVELNDGRFVWMHQEKFDFDQGGQEATFKFEVADSLEHLKQRVEIVMKEKDE